VKVQINVKEWKVLEESGTRKIVGNLDIKSGSSVIATQSFNEGYGCTTLLFSQELMIEVEKLTEKIQAEAVKGLGGEE